MTDTITIQTDLNFPLHKLDDLIEESMPKLKGINLAAKKMLVAKAIAWLVLTDAEKIEDLIADALIENYELSDF